MSINSAPSSFVSFNSYNTQNFSNSISLSGKYIKHLGIAYSGNSYWTTPISDSTEGDSLPYPYNKVLFYLDFYYGQEDSPSQKIILNSLGILDIFNISNLTKIQVHSNSDNFNLNEFEPDKLNIEIQYE